MQRRDVSGRRRAGGKECGRRKTWEGKSGDLSTGDVLSFQGVWGLVRGETFCPGTSYSEFLPAGPESLGTSVPSTNPALGSGGKGDLLFIV